MNRHAITSLVATAGTVLAAGAASAQSFNVDLGASAGTGSGAISSSFAACGQPGTWNVLFPTTAQNVTLANTSGASTSVTLARPAGVTAVVPPGNADTGDFARLMSDGFQVNTVNDTDHYTFNGLTEGRYLVYVYFANAAAGIDARADVAGFVGQSMQVTGGSAANTFKAGANYTLSLADVTSNGQLSIAITRMNAGDQANVAGFSLVKLNGARKPIHVKEGGSGDRSGSSWANAMPSVIEPMQLLNGAYAYETEMTDNTVDLDMWIAGGVYKVTQASNPTRFERLYIIDGMTMYGGFAGTETHPAQRTGGHETVISGELGFPWNSDNSYKLAVFDKCSDRTVVDTMTFEKAYDERVSASLFEGRGAAVAILESDPSGDDGPIFRDVTFRDNVAGSEGGAVYIYLADTTFENCLFENNDTLASNSNGQGGAVADYSGGSTYLYTDFLYNSSKYGAAAYLRYSGADFLGCRFLGNQGSTSTIHISNGSDSQFGNCLIAGNSNGFNSAAVYSAGENADVRFENTTIAHNTSVGYSAGVLLRDGADAYVLNSIIWGNTPSLVEPGFEGQASIDVVNGPTNVAFAYASVQNGSTMEVPFNTATFLNNTSNPLFVDFNGPDNVLGNLDDDYRLAAGSPAIDSADTSFAPTDDYDLDANGIIWETVPYDLAGRARVVDVPGVGANGSVNVIDRGAYEFARPCGADLNNDGVLNFFDVQAFLAAFSAGQPLADFIPDNTLNFFDVQEFLNQFSAGCP